MGDFHDLQLVGNQAYYRCSSLIVTSLPSTVTSVGSGAFMFCSNITEIVLHDGLVTIGASAFAVTRVTSLTIPDSVTSLSFYALNSIPTLTTLVIGNGVTAGVPDKLFFNNRVITSVTMGNGIPSVGFHSFSRCYALSQFTFGSNMTTVGPYAFSESTSLVAITLPSGVTTIDQNAFEGCTALTSVAIPDSVTSIGHFAFAGCTSLYCRIWNAAVVRSMGWEVFRGCPLTGCTASPTMMPTAPTVVPSIAPSAMPTESPSRAPSGQPTAVPSLAPTPSPSIAPSASPSETPSLAPTTNPSIAPSAGPSETPTLAPTPSPSITPSASPSEVPSLAPTPSPSVTPSASPSEVPSLAPSPSPSVTPSAIPSKTPSLAPTTNPSIAPSASPSESPSLAPSPTPTVAPSPAPTPAPSMRPTRQPVIFPTRLPTFEGATAAPTAGPTVQSSPVATFDSTVGLAGLSSNQELGQTDQEAVAAAVCVSMNISTEACTYVPPTLFTEVPGRRLHQHTGYLRALDTSVYNAKSKVNVAVLLKAFPQFANDASQLFVALTTQFDNSDFAENLYEAAAKTGAATVLESTYTGSEFSALNVVDPPPAEDSGSKDSVLSMGAIIGIAVGGAALLLMVLAAVWYCCTSQKQPIVQDEQSDTLVESETQASAAEGLTVAENDAVGVDSEGRDATEIDKFNNHTVYAVGAAENTNVDSYVVVDVVDKTSDDGHAI